VWNPTFGYGLPPAIGGLETRAPTRRGGQSVFTRVTKPVVEDGKLVFDQWIAVNSPAAVNQRQVLKLALHTPVKFQHQLKTAAKFSFARKINFREDGV
jgi:hypothetical protein